MAATRIAILAGLILVCGTGLTACSGASPSSAQTAGREPGSSASRPLAPASSAGSTSPAPLARAGTAGYAGQVSVPFCPSSAAIGKLTGSPMAGQGEIGSTPAIYCPYYTTGLPALNPETSPSKAALEITALDTRGTASYTTLAGARRKTEQGCAGKCLITDLPTLGPGAYEQYASVTGGTGRSLSACIVWISDQYAYPVNVTAVARNGAGFRYTGSMSRHTLCGWAQGLAELLMGAPP